MAQLQASSEVLESLVAEQRGEILRYQASYDALSERYTGMHAKMYEGLAELNAYKLRVEELEGKYKRLYHDWSVVTVWLSLLGP